MKKILVVGWAIAALVLWADETAPTESPIVGGSSCDIGVYNVTGAVGVANVLIPVRFKALDQGEADTDALTVSQLMRLDNISEGDQLIRFNGNEYDAWIYNGNSWEAPKNSISLGTKIPVSSNPNDADSESLVVGEALWLIRANPSEQVEITLFGKYIEPADLTSTISRSSTAVTYNLIANPTGRTISGAEMEAAISTIKPQQGDQIVLFESGATLRTYNYSTSKGWTYGPNKNGLVDIRPHYGFWYVAKIGDKTESLLLNWPGPDSGNVGE